MTLNCPCCCNELPLRPEFLGRKIKCSYCHSKFRLHEDLSIDILHRSKVSYLGPSVSRNFSSAELKDFSEQDNLEQYLVKNEDENDKTENTAIPKLRRKRRRLKPGESAFSWWPVFFFILALLSLPVSVYLLRPDLLQPLQSLLAGKTTKEILPELGNTNPKPIQQEPELVTKAEAKPMDPSPLQISIQKTLDLSSAKISTFEMSRHQTEVERLYSEMNKIEIEYQTMRQNRITEHQKKMNMVKSN